MALFTARSRVATDLEQLDRLLVRQAVADPACRRVMTTTGVGAITAKGPTQRVNLTMAYRRLYSSRGALHADACSKILF
jgi:hypothetical protein